MIRVYYKNEQYELEESMSVYDFLEEIVQEDMNKIMACKVFNEVKSLNFVIDRDCKVESLDITTSDGNRIYVRGLVFVMLKAFEELYPNEKFIVNYALGHSLFCEATTNFIFTEEDIVKIKEMLVDRAKKNTKKLEKELPFIISLKAALEAYCKGRDISIKKVMLKEFANDMQTIIDLYSDLPKKTVYKRKKFE